MADGPTWDVHAVRIKHLFSVQNASDDLNISQKKCVRNHPPGRKVYQRGAHTIWEVDGAKDKVCRYCSTLCYLS
jgi:hypothetical protein